eukprot:5058892-Alexandrium_andersonii.AAC.1
MAELLRKHQSQFYSLDATFRIEESFFLGMVGEAGSQRLQVKVDQHLPTATIVKDLGSSLQALQTLQSSALYKFCAASAQGQ